jgi:hypothetical protein
MVLTNLQLARRIIWLIRAHRRVRSAEAKRRLERSLNRYVAEYRERIANSTEWVPILGILYNGQFL